MVELEDKGRQARAIKSTALLTRSKDNTKRGLSQGLSRGGHNKDGGSTSHPKGSKEKYVHCNSTGHSKDTYWKKYPEHAPSWWKKDSSNDPKPDSKNRGRKDGATLNLAAIAGSYDHATASHAFPSHIHKM